MNQKLKQTIYGVVLLGGGIFIGSLIDIADTTTSMTDMYFNSASSNLKLHVTLLNLLKANNTEKCNRLLEGLVDADLIVLADYSKIPKSKRSIEVLKPIEKAKEYRQKYPEPNKSEAVSATIKKTFDLVK